MDPATVLTGVYIYPSVSAGAKRAQGEFRVEGNKVIVAFRGMCAQCKMAEVTMRDVVEASLREFVSDELVVVEQKDPPGESDIDGGQQP